MTEEQYRLNKWGTKLLKNNRPLFDWANESDDIVDLLNELNDENIELHIQNDFLKNENQHMRDLVNENKIFREALKELKEIGDYQAMRIKELDDMNSLIEDEIDKKIAVLTDAKIQCFQNEDEVLFGKIKFGIQILNELKEVMCE